MKKARMLTLFGILVGALLLALACAPQPVPTPSPELAPVETPPPAPAPATSEGNAGRRVDYETPAGATAHFVLETTVLGREWAFVGIQGPIEGMSNPTLGVNQGDVVAITVVNGDGIQHDLVIPGLEVGSPRIAQKGEFAHVLFKADAVGEYQYRCELPGHVLLGMQGALVVSQ